MALENEVSLTATRLSQQFGESFLGSVIDHQPNYSVTYIFANDVTVAQLQSLIAPSLRSVAKAKRSRYDSKEIAERRQKLIEALVSAKIGGSVGYDFRTDKFEVTAESNGHHC